MAYLQCKDTAETVTAFARELALKVQQDTLRFLDLLNPHTVYRFRARHTRNRRPPTP
jgi:hypothetical protein